MRGKILMTLGVAVIALGACASSNAPVTSWGKPGVSMVDYRTDAGQCAIHAATYNPNLGGETVAGGLSGANVGARTSTGGDSAIASGQTQSNNAGLPSGGSLYRDTVPDDYLVRANNQQTAQQNAVRRARNEALSGCLRERGYREFRLTSEQRAHAASLPEGSPERRQYLYSLGADEAVLNRQGL